MIRLITRCDKIRKNRIKPSEPDKKPSGDKESTKPSSDKDKKGSDKEQGNGKPYETRLTELIGIYTSQPPLEKRTTILCGKHNLYERPAASSLSSAFRRELKFKGRCQNCGDCDPLFASHDLSHCPHW